MKYQALIEKLTLDEKASLLSGLDFWQSKPIKRIGLPSMFLADGPHGIRKQAGAADQLGLNASVKATCYPTAATMANSWDINLCEELGRFLGKEAAALQVHVLLGPGLNIKRSPLCGRNFEYYSEDPYLAGKIAAAYVRGIQSQGVAACPKHLAVNSQELLRMANDSVVDERTLREIYLTAFEIVVRESTPKAIMSSYNKINGTYANENSWLLTKVLREGWGFDGFVVSDWGGSNDHVAGVRAGANLEMPTTGGDSDHELAEAIRKGQMEEQVVDQRVDELLSVLFDVANGAKSAVKTEFDIEAHHAFARKAAEESIVLLKNEDQLLPLKEGSRVALIGEFAAHPRYQGAGSSVVNCTRLDCINECIKDSGLDIIGFEPGYSRTDSNNAEPIEKACALVEKSEVLLVFIGLDEISETEGLDRSHMRLAKNQLALIEQLKATGKPMVAVISAGSPVEMPWINAFKAVVHGYLSGQAGAGAMVRVLTGQVNPSGKLGESYPYAYGDVPNAKYYPGTEKTSEYREGLFVGYRYYDTARVPVRFHFGYGLSYTTFEYSGLEILPGKVCLTVTNTGTRDGKEIVQLYISCPQGAVFRPEKELKGFCKVELQAGERKNVSITLDDKAFRYFNVRTGRYEIETATYYLSIGASCQDIRLTGQLQVQGGEAVLPYHQDCLLSYCSGQITRVSDSEFEYLLGHKVPQARWDRSRLLERNDAISQLFYAKSRIARLAYKILTGIKNRSEKDGKPNLNILFIYNMPFRGIAKMTGGAMTMTMVDGLLEVVNGRFFRGIRQIIKGMKQKKSNKRGKLP